MTKFTILKITKICFTQIPLADNEEVGVDEKEVDQVLKWKVLLKGSRNTNLKRKGMHNVSREKLKKNF